MNIFNINKEYTQKGTVFIIYSTAKKFDRFISTVKLFKSCYSCFFLFFLFIFYLLMTATFMYIMYMVDWQQQTKGHA